MNIYEKFDAATKQTSAYAIMHQGKYIGRVIFKRGNGLRQTCFAQLWGMTMTTGFAGGGGYDKHTASFESAVEKFKVEDGNDPIVWAHAKAWKLLFSTSSGEAWNNRLISNGYQVLNVV
jgi:hypothetical protein